MQLIFNQMVLSLIILSDQKPTSAGLSDASKTVHHTPHVLGLCFLSKQCPLIKRCFVLPCNYSYLDIWNPGLRKFLPGILIISRWRSLLVQICFFTPLYDCNNFNLPGDFTLRNAFSSLFLLQRYCACAPYPSRKIAFHLLLRAFI